MTKCAIKGSGKCKVVGAISIYLRDAAVLNNIIVIKMSHRDNVFISQKNIFLFGYFSCFSHLNDFK